MNFSVWRLESGGAEGQHRSVATGNTMMLLMKAYSVQVPSRGSFAQKDEYVRFKPGSLGKAAPPNGENLGMGVALCAANLTMFVGPPAPRNCNPHRQCAARDHLLIWRRSGH